MDDALECRKKKNGKWWGIKFLYCRTLYQGHTAYINGVYNSTGCSIKVFCKNDYKNITHWWLLVVFKWQISHPFYDDHLEVNNGLPPRAISAIYSPCYLIPGPLQTWNVGIQCNENVFGSINIASDSCEVFNYDKHNWQDGLQLATIYVSTTASL